MALIASHNTQQGWAVGIVSEKHYRTGEEFFKIVRMDRNSVYVVTNYADTEVKARELANKLWLQEMGRGEKMIGCGPGAL